MPKKIMNNRFFPKQITLIHGNQQLLIEETCNSIIEQILKGNKNDCCVERFDMEEMIKSYSSSSNNVIEDFFISSETLPLFNDIKLILVKNFDLIKKPNTKNSSSSTLKLYNSIINLIEKPPEYMWLILISKASRESDFSKKLYQLLSKKWYIKKFVSYDDTKPINWILDRSKNRGLSLSKEIAQLFIDIVGNDLFELDHELEKMAIFFSGKKVSEELIKKNLHGHKNFTIFKMTESLSNKKLLPALEILDNQLKTSPNEHLRLFSIIVMQFRRLMAIKSLSKQLYNENEILRNISVPTFLGKQLLKQSKNFKYEELQNIYLELSNLDLKIKFKNHLAPLLLYEFFKSICEGKFEKI